MSNPKSEQKYLPLIALLFGGILVTLGLYLESHFHILGDKAETIRVTEVSDAARPGREIDPYIKNQVKNTILKRAAELQTCYNDFLKSDPATSEGRITVDWQIDPKGRTLSPQTVLSHLNSPVLETCMHERIATWIFPIPPSGRNTYVGHTFIFKKETLGKDQKIASNLKFKK